MTLLTRQFGPNPKGSKLSIQEMDNNLLYLETQEYKQSLLPSKSLSPQSIARPDLVGRIFDLEKSPSGTPFIELNNGNVASVSYCQSVLPNGILIYEGYDEETEEEISGYWVAFKQDETNPKLLVKVAELQMTQQFLDNGYNYTAKDSGDNVVKFVMEPNIEQLNMKSFITTLTYNNGVLTATDSSFIFGDALDLYNSLAGTDFGKDYWSTSNPEYILDDDYYGMAMGTEAGWMYYRYIGGFELMPWDPPLVPEPATTMAWNCVGMNILTGETRFVRPFADVVSIYPSITNFNFDYVFLNILIQDWFNHPNGIAFIFADGQAINNGNNVDGVACVWSPFFDNPNEVIYINSRNIQTGEFLATGNMPKSGSDVGWYWDNENIYVWQRGVDIGYGGLQGIFATRFNTNTKEVKSWTVPNFMESDDDSVWSFANNNGLMLNRGLEWPNEYDEFGRMTYLYFSNNNNFLSLQSNNWVYPTNMFGNKVYGTWSPLSFNVFNLTILIDEYAGVSL